MSLRTRTIRLLAGCVVLAATLVAGFSIYMSQMPRWGATAEEAASTLPGDEILSAPDVDWTNARTISAPPEQVWPWLAQIGDTRGGFYSFTFIEDRVGALTGGAGYTVDYTNANAIHPEWQTLQPGEEIIQGLLKWDRFERGKWLLASSTNPDIMGWAWAWQITPTPDGKGTRLVNRIGIQAMAGADNPVMSFFIGNGAFIMEQRMMNGIKAHAEGWIEPPYQEALEAVLWFIALLAGVVSAVAFVARRAWFGPLVVAVASVFVVVTLTFAQPAIWVRILLDAALVAGLATSLRVQLPRRSPAILGTAQI